MELSAEFLLKKGYEVHGIKRSSSFNTKRIDHLYKDHIDVRFNTSLWRFNR